ncbi:SWIM zinc finger domain-containing protein [Paenibacillus solisilvae]|uniref:SWIM zinc finger domain-containing protein n=1 Tax=Paenibacillus solisilvae TaxID=2486751 RepID=A0ABW0W6L8_9BACL
MMKTIHTLDDIQWEQLVHQVGDSFDDLTIKRGFQYYKQERVLKLEMPAPLLLEAVIEGNEPYLVKVQLDALPVSTCTCPVRRSCKHMIAALLHYASLQERSIHAIVNARSTASLSKKAFKPAPSAAAASAKLREMAVRIPEMTVAQWHELFELGTSSLSDNTPNAQYVKEALAAIYAVKPSLSPVVEQLFGLHAHFFVLEKLVKQSLHHTQNPWQTSGTYMGFHTHVAADSVREAIEQSFANGLPVRNEPEQWERISQTAAYLRRRMLTEAKSLTYFLDLYYRLWMNWVHPNLSSGDTQLYKEELTRLLEAPEAVEAALSKLPWMLAQSRMHFYLAQDDQALALLHKASESSRIRPEDLYPCLQTLSQSASWPRLALWLEEVGPLLSSYRKGSLEPYLIYWQTAVEHLPESEPRMWQSFVRMLPFSRDIYEESMLFYGKWQQWMDYHLSTGREPADFRVSELQPIEKNAPELLLPFYHQAVERNVLEKNRHSYKAAVRLLKRLNKLYKKLKQEDRWELFFSAFSGRHSRLRALQEELRKGKLLS